MNKQNILVVDDAPTIRMMLRAMLELDYNIIEASNGKEALNVLQINPSIDLIMLDFKMPIMNGIETLNQMKQKQLSYKVLMINADDDEILRNQAKGLGAIDFIQKPFSMEHLTEKIKSLI